MVEVRRLTTEEVNARLAELDAKHPTWREVYDTLDCECCFGNHPEVNWDWDQQDYTTYRWFAEAGA